MVIAGDREFQSVRFKVEDGVIVIPMTILAWYGGGHRARRWGGLALALITGAVEAMVVDYQCILPSLGDLAACYHTQFYTSSPKAKFPKGWKALKPYLRLTPQPK